MNELWFTKEALNTHLMQWLRVVFLLFCASFVYYGLIRQATLPPSISGNAYLKLEIKGRIAAIHYYDRGYPVVTINQQRITLAVPGLASKYLQVQDSLVKHPNQHRVTSYRFSPNSIESIVWESSKDGSSENMGRVSSTIYPR